MTYLVRVKPGHPTGRRRRSGMEFTTTAVEISEKELTRDIRKDRWLLVERVKGEQSTPPPDRKKSTVEGNGKP